MMVMTALLLLLQNSLHTENGNTMKPIPITAVHVANKYEKWDGAGRKRFVQTNRVFTSNPVTQIAAKQTKETKKTNVALGNLQHMIYNNQSSYGVEGTAEANTPVHIEVTDADGKQVSADVTANKEGLFQTSINGSRLKNGNVQVKAAAGEQAALKTVEKDGTFYELNKKEQEKWHISNDGTHPIESTKGMNDALQFAKANALKTFKVPAGTYMVKKENPALSNDPSACINMVPNITFWLDENAVIQKETNAREVYSTVCVGYGADNVTLKGGTYKGDKDTHDYSKKQGPSFPGTHENGIGISVYAAKNLTIDGVKATNFTGDGAGIGGKGTLLQDIYPDHFESGSLDKNGNKVADPTKIRLKAPIPFTKDILKTEPYFEMPNAKNLPYLYDVYFYQADGSFLSSYSVNTGKEVVQIPKSAASFKAVFKKANTSGVYGEFWSKALAKNVTVKHSDFSFNRRQGITVGGADHVTITDSVFHDIKGVAPESGIDVEGGYGENGMMNKNIFIKNNKFYNNNKYDVILYDGHDGVVEGNHFGSRGKIGLAVSEPFTNAYIKNNTFDANSIYAYHDITFEGNSIKDGLMSITGPRAVVDGMTFDKTMFSLSSRVPFGIEAKNLTLNNMDLNVWVNPVHVSNVTINGGRVGGQAPDGSTFDNLKVLNHPGTSFVRGTYNNCMFESSPTATGGTHVDYNGTYIFQNCTFKAAKGTFNVGNKDANVTIQNSRFDINGDTTVLNIPMGKQINVVNNTITSGLLPGMNKAVIKVGDYWNKDKPFQGQQANITGNTITTGAAVEGISTIYGGVNAPAYRVQNNILHKAFLKVKPKDIVNGNQELPN
ncbi:MULTISPECIES: right-handed parallel beta-helix repeat-containing protein [unclassified Bacillus (in: firmicutes)]|uniref:right-handed parallel beta-helix repeat-containing protein n=1 Tax=unclassified Bacillus (in: firmicutes) TaxID=185979 RepID=UPI0008E29823|nr:MULTISPECIES: right-handed parallel beta-helix repeat-containing protein [unclassified Bacillus (in: firmicutes)]SFJ76530.1 Right handed beta helix region [Bacillus sp. 71mf]SFT16635.1 Right handed beta helix region [Bacillus sp. 103mf]